jgi:hypothetical protein
MDSRNDIGAGGKNADREKGFFICHLDDDRGIGGEIGPGRGLFAGGSGGDATGLTRGQEGGILDLVNEGVVGMRALQDLNSIQGRGGDALWTRIDLDDRMDVG